MRDEWSKFRDVNGVNTHHLEAGSGPPLLLIHGGGAFSCGEMNWGYVISPFSSNFRVFAPDQIGFGFTPLPHNDYSLGARGEHMINFIESLGLGPMYVVGNSHGGWLATYVSVKRPDLVRKLVIVNSGSTSSLLSIESPGIREEFPTMFSADAYTKLPTLEGVRKSLMQHTFRKELVTDERVKRAYEIAVRNHHFHSEREKATQNSIDARNHNVSINGRHISEYVHDLKMPVLLIWGKYDEGVARLENGLKLHQKIPGAEMHIFDNAKHLPMVDSPHRFVSVVNNFLAFQNDRYLPDQP